MIWIIDSDIFIEGERGHPKFSRWLQTHDKFSTADIVRAEFLMGVHQTSDAAKRRRGEQFYRDIIAMLPSFPNESADYTRGAQMAGDARRAQKGSPSLVDSLIAAIALRTVATVATRNVKDFKAMGCPCENPLD
ncbi:MAG: type II toxin-antitoxin system VapC family toxin [Limisphaerales bacterium]